MITDKENPEQDPRESIIQIFQAFQWEPPTPIMFSQQDYEYAREQYEIQVKGKKVKPKDRKKTSNSFVEFLFKSKKNEKT